MTVLSFFFADAYTQRPFAGNTAGVVTTAGGLSTAQMQAIARELGQSETCFVGGTGEPGADLALRWFTPTVEVDICGHASVAAFVCLDAEGRIAWVDDAAHVRCATRTGAIDVWLARGAGDTATVVMSVGRPVVERAVEDREAVAAAIGLSAFALDHDLPLAIERAGSRLIVPVARLHDLLQLTPNGAGMIEYGLPLGYRRFTLICRETENPEHAVHLRHFAPANGIAEDPVTGTAHAVAAVYLDGLGLLPSGERAVIIGEQGRAVGRRGAVTVEVFRQAGQVREVRIGGSGVIVAQGTMRTPETAVD